MRAYGAKVCSCGLLLLTGLPVWGARTQLRRDRTGEARMVVSADENDLSAMRESLRRDVLAHPGNFVVFETEVGARRFLALHASEIQPETNRAIVSRGVLGYWEGKTMVVLPWEPVKNAVN